MIFLLHKFETVLVRMKCIIKTALTVKELQYKENTAALLSVFLGQQILLEVFEEVGFVCSSNNLYILIAYLKDNYIVKELHIRRMH